MEIVDAIFENGQFRPDHPLLLPEGSRVRLAVEPMSSAPASPSFSVEERRAIRLRALDRISANPVPSGAPRFNREDLYDRG